MSVEALLLSAKDCSYSCSSPARNQLNLDNINLVMPTGFEPANIGMKTLGVKPLLNGTACLDAFTLQRPSSSAVFSLGLLPNRPFINLPRNCQG